MNENINFYYQDNGKDITVLIQEWINENSSFWNYKIIPNNDKLDSR